MRKISELYKDLLDRSMNDGSKLKIFGSNGVKLVVTVCNYDEHFIYYNCHINNEEMLINIDNVFTIVRSYDE